MCVIASAEVTAIWLGKPKSQATPTILGSVNLTHECVQAPILAVCLAISAAEAAACAHKVHTPATPWIQTLNKGINTKLFTLLIDNDFIIFIIYCKNLKITLNSFVRSLHFNNKYLILKYLTLS